MKVVDKRELETKVRDLETGEVFLVSSKFYMKTQDICIDARDAERPEISKKQYNCIGLTDGFLYHYTDGIVVQLVDVELHVTRNTSRNTESAPVALKSK